MNKFNFVIIAFLTLVLFNSYSQNVRMNGYALHTLDDDIETSDGNYYFNRTMKGNLLWGVGFEYLFNKYTGIELAYFREDTDVPTNYFNGITYDKTFKIGLNYIMFGGTGYAKIPSKSIEPFAGGLLGMAIITNKEPSPGAESSATKFAWMIKAGVNIMASKNVGLKLQAQLLSVVQAFGGGFYLGTGGSGAGFSSYSSMMQIGFGGGIVFNFGK